MNSSNIRNFCIIAHIDHGKSTLADRFLELTGTVEKRKMKEQVLDSMDLERERGITIKMTPVRMIWRPNHPESDFEIPSFAPRLGSGLLKDMRNSKFEISDSEFILNLIDTPGHVDFSYEVSRALAAVEGAILLVDATKGVQAQTLANLKIALEQGLIVIPAVNKIDLAQARIAETEKEIEDLFLSFYTDEGRSIDGIFDKIYRVSGKTGQGAEELLNSIVEKIPSPDAATAYRPRSNTDSPFRALIFDSMYDSYKGVVMHVRVKNGYISKNDKIRFMASGLESSIKELGYFSPGYTSADKLEEGEIGYIATGLKEIEKIKIGDTILKLPITNYQLPIIPLPGYHEPQPLVFASVYPEEGREFDALKDAILQLKLNDASLYFEPDYSEALGRGIKLGFLGMLHMDIIFERLKREFGIKTILTAPSVVYEVEKKDGEKELVYTPSKFPEASQIEKVFEPYALLEILTPSEYLSSIMTILKDMRGEYKETESLGKDLLRIRYNTPLAEIITGFYDKLKSVSSGFASAAYTHAGIKEADVLKMDIVLAGEKVESLSRIVPREKVYEEGKRTALKIKEILPAEQFAVAIQAAVGGKIIARETRGAMRKDVTGYLYGGDYTRKRKLLEKQKKGKKRLRERGKVHLDSETFMKIFKG